MQFRGAIATQANPFVLAEIHLVRPDGEEADLGKDFIGLRIGHELDSRDAGEDEGRDSRRMAGQIDGRLRMLGMSLGEVVNSGPD